MSEVDRPQGAAPRIALVSAREALALDEDMPALLEALAACGAAADVVVWDDPAVAWQRYRLAVLRSTWDYVDRIAEFLAWTRRCAGLTRLVNAAEVVRWNTDKHYLQALAAAGVAIVPTRFVEPGADPAAGLDGFLRVDDGSSTVVFQEFVVKPAIGAGSRDTARYARGDRAVALEHLARLGAAGRAALLQPYLEAVDSYGETAVIYLGGEYSHAARKGPLLRAGAGPVSGLFAPEEISAREPDAAERRVADAAYRALPFAPLPYARIDLIRDAAGEPVVLEVELTEPSLFFACAPGAASRYAQALLAL